MMKPEYNTYQITLIVRDISKTEAISLADAVKVVASVTDSKTDEGRFPEDVSIIVSHVKGVEVGDLSA